MSEHSEAIASEVKDALEIADVVVEYFLDRKKWLALRANAPKRCLPHVEEAAVDIGRDMLVEAGFYFDEEVAEFCNSLLSAFEIGFLYGAAFQEDPSNNPDPYKHRRSIDPDLYGGLVSHCGVEAAEMVRLNYGTVEPEPEPSQHFRTVRTAYGQDIKIVNSLEDWLFFELLDKAVEAFNGWVDLPSNEKRAVRDEMIDMMRSILDGSEQDAFWVVQHAALNARMHEG